MINVTFCVPRAHTCSNTQCLRHESKAPIGVMLSWTDYWEACVDKKEDLKHAIYFEYKGKVNVHSK